VSSRGCRLAQNCVPRRSLVLLKPTTWTKLSATSCFVVLGTVCPKDLTSVAQAYSGIGKAKTTRNSHTQSEMASRHDPTEDPFDSILILEDTLYTSPKHEPRADQPFHPVCLSTCSSFSFLGSGSNARCCFLSWRRSRAICLACFVVGRRMAQLICPRMFVLSAE
jgi:hypothetical protein